MEEIHCIGLETRLESTCANSTYMNRQPNQTKQVLLFVLANMHSHCLFKIPFVFVCKVRWVWVMGGAPRSARKRKIRWWKTAATRWVRLESTGNGRIRKEKCLCILVCATSAATLACFRYVTTCDMCHFKFLQTEENVEKCQHKSQHIFPCRISWAQAAASDRETEQS